MATSLELAITAIRSGRKEEGRQLLNLLIQQNPNNENAWLWMSSVVNTDEQRARCLYHVLAINPDNELARRGLQLLGIVVSDSRPVKVPRDSQPIPVQRPQAETTASWSIPQPAPSRSPLETQPMERSPLHAPQAAPAPNQTAPMEERRPFRLDPRTITQELPFVPVREPFAEPARRAPSAFAPRAEADQPAPAQIPQPAESVAAVPSASAGQDPAVNPGMALVPLTPPGATQSPPSDPAASTLAASAPDSGLPANSTPPSATPANQAQPDAASTPPPQPQPSQMSVNETRPSQPIWTAPSNPTTSMPPAAPQNQPQPYPTPGINSNVTMSMPTPYFQPQPPIQGALPIHSNATMGMPMQPQPGQMPHPSEAMPLIPQNGAMGMPYGPAPYQQPFYPQNQVFHSNSTMAMPTMTEAQARAQLMASQPMPGTFDPYAALRVGAGQPASVSRASKKSSKKVSRDDDEEEEEVNLMAVIVFGSLSVTALGGMGMLILLWFTSF